MHGIPHEIETVPIPKKPTERQHLGLDDDVFDADFVDETMEVSSLEKRFVAASRDVELRMTGDVKGDTFWDGRLTPRKRALSYRLKKVAVPPRWKWPKWDNAPLTKKPKRG